MIYFGHSLGIMESLLFACCIICFVIKSTFGDNLSINGYTIDINSFEEMTMSRPDGGAIQLTMVGLYERDQHGNSITPSGHTLNVTSRTAQNFTANDPCTKAIPNSNTRGRFIDADTILSDGSDQTTRVGYNVYFITTAGQVILNTGHDKELQRVYPNNVRVTLTLSGWRWCSPCGGNNGDSVTGAFLDVEMSLQLPPGAVVREENVVYGPKELNLGNRMTLYLSNQVKKGDSWENMPQNFLQISGEDQSRPGNYNFTIRLPKFDHSIMYDTVFSLDHDDKKFNEDDNEPSKVQCTNDSDDNTPVAGVARQESLFFWSLIMMLVAVRKL